MEFAADADELEARAGARRGLHRDHQAVRVHVGVDARVRAALRRGGLSRKASSTSSPGSGPKSATALVAHPKIAHVGFTGGDAAGRKIYQLAASGLKTVTLELGGKSPNIVFDDADLDQAVKGVVSGIFAASGQTCQAGSRLLLQREHPRPLRRKARRVRARPPRWAIRRCPTRRSARSRRGRSSRRFSTTSGSRRTKARAAFSAARAAPTWAPGMFIEPTIFTGVRNSMRIAQEEVFGPVLAVIPFDDEADAIRIGNDVVYGLAAAVWTKSLRRAMLMTDKLQGRDGLGQQLPRDELHVAVWRLQEFRHRPRVRRRDHQGIPDDQVRLDFHRSRRSQSVHPPLDDRHDAWPRGNP